MIFGLVFFWFFGFFGFFVLLFCFPSFVICSFGVLGWVGGSIFMVIICVGGVLHHPSFYLYKKTNSG